MNTDYRTQPDAPQLPQAILPRFSIASYFITVLVLSAVIGLAIQSGSVRFQLLIGLLIAPVVVFLVISAAAFVAAFTIGALKRLLFEPISHTQSPFASETMPPQVIPRQARD